jgi:hypothetical protein
MGVALILEILQAALGGLTALGKSKVSEDAGIAQGFVTIIQKAQAAYESATGQTLDLTKIPQEAKV